MLYGKGTKATSILDSQKMMKDYAKLLAKQAKQIQAVIETNDAIEKHLAKSKLTARKVKAFGKGISK